jgi:hypothetical protein
MLWVWREMGGPAGLSPLSEIDDAEVYLFYLDQLENCINDFTASDGRRFMLHDIPEEEMEFVRSISVQLNGVLA